MKILVCIFDMYKKILYGKDCFSNFKVAYYSSKLSNVNLEKVFR